MHREGITGSPVGEPERGEHNLHFEQERSGETRGTG